MTEIDFEACSLWPIRVELPQGRGYCLWGSGGGDTDRLLAVAGRLRSFARWPALVDFVLDGAACNLSEPDGYRRLREQLARPGQRVPDAVHEYALVEIGRWLSAPAGWAAPRRSAALDGLNLLWDAAVTLDDAGLRAQLRRDAVPLGRLMDALTFSDDDAAAQAIADALASGAAAEYARVLAAVAARWDAA